MSAHHHERIAKAPSYPHLANIALEILAAMPGTIGQVCGPITSGGRGSFAANIAFFTEAIASLETQGVTVFSQMPFEDRMQELKVVDGYNWPVLNEFYGPIFASGLVRRLYFLPGWENSCGSCWEREQADIFGIAVTDLDENFRPLVDA